MKNLTHLFQYRDLLATWTLREIRLRYKQTILGGVWAILQPLALMIIFTLVFSVLTDVPTDDVPYPIFSYTGLLPWIFFATSISFAVPSLVNNMNLITKIAFPREILPVASVGTALLDFGIASLLLVGFMVAYDIAASWTILWIPVILATQILFTLGVVLSLSALNVFYRDIRFVIPLMTQVWLYASPVIYPVSAVPENLRTLYFLNPIAGIIDSYRRVLLMAQPPNLPALLWSAAAAIVFFVAGYRYFKRSEPEFADLI